MIEPVSFAFGVGVTLVVLFAMGIPPGGPPPVVLGFPRAAWRAGERRMTRCRP